MKYIVFLLGMMAFVPAQKDSKTLELGAKAGLIFASEPEIDVLHSSISDLNQQAKSQSTAAFGGLFLQVNLPKIYLRPEVYISNYKQEFVDANNQTFNQKNYRLDVPVLVGKEFLDLFFAHTGIVGSYYFEDKSSLRALEQTTSVEAFSFAYQLGGGIKYKDISVELRWEKPLTERTLELVTQETTYQLKTNPNQFLVSVGYRF